MTGIFEIKSVLQAQCSAISFITGFIVHFMFTLIRNESQDWKQGIKKKKSGQEPEMAEVCKAV